MLLPWHVSLLQSCANMRIALKHIATLRTHWIQRRKKAEQRVVQKAELKAVQRAEQKAEQRAELKAEKRE